MSLSSLGIVVALFSVTLLIIIYLIDINRYKGKIVRILKKNTGRRFEFEDRIYFTIYPWLGLNLGKVKIGNAPGFETLDFASINTVKVRIKLIPLVAKRIEIDTIRLEGMIINFRRQSDGRNNWDDLLQTAPKESKKPPSKKQPAQLPIDFEKFKIQGLDINHLNLTFDDQQTQSYYVFADLKLKTSPICLNQPIQVELNTAFNMTNVNAFDGQVSLETKVILKFEKSKQPTVMSR